MHRVRQQSHAPLCSPAPKGQPWPTAGGSGRRRNTLSSRLLGPRWLKQTQTSMRIELSRVAAEGAQPFRVVPADDQTGLVYTTLAQLDHDLAGATCGLLCTCCSLACLVCRDRGPASEALQKPRMSSDSCWLLQRGETTKKTLKTTPSP